MVWYSHLFKEFSAVFFVIHTVKGYDIVNRAEVDFFKFPCLFYVPADVGTLISGSSDFSKSSLYIGNFSVHVLLKPGLKDFEHYLLASEKSAIV